LDNSHNSNSGDINHKDTPLRVNNSLVNLLRPDSLLRAMDSPNMAKHHHKAMDSLSLLRATDNPNMVNNLKVMDSLLRAMDSPNMAKHHHKAMDSLSLLRAMVSPHKAMASLPTHTVDTATSNPLSSPLRSEDYVSIKAILL
jgi:hypothetical protein